MTPARDDEREWRTVEDYLAELLALVAVLPARRAHLAECLGEVLREDVLARVPVPGFDVSAMDGYAVRWADIEGAGGAAEAGGSPVRLRVVADLPAGSGEDPALAAGECARIMTGAPLPAAADTVVPVELTDGGVDEVVVHEAPDRGRGAHIRRAGEDVRVGDVVCTAGTRLGAGAIATAAATGHAELMVGATPRVAVASTGSELRAPGEALSHGQIHESNSWFVAASMRAEGADVVVHPALRDEHETIATALDGMAASADLIVLTGGAGAGAHDVPGQVLRTAEECAFRRVLAQPGKPQGWARWRGVPVLLLPGNPVAAAVSTAVFVRPVLRALAGRASQPQSAYAVASQPFRGSPGRRQLVPAIAAVDETGTMRVEPAHVRGLGAHLVSSLVRANVLAVVPDEADGAEAGSVLEVLPFGTQDGGTTVSAGQ